VDRGDFAAAVDRHYPGLVQRLTLVLHDAEEAKDVAQEAYLKAFGAWSRFDGTDENDTMTVAGMRSSDFASVCMVGILYEASEVLLGR
jgi:hypothetical protein